MSGTNETRSGEALESVVQSQQDGDGALNPSVQSAALKMATETIRLHWLQAKRNVKDSRPHCDGFYHRYNSGRESAFRQCLEWLDVAIQEYSVSHEDEHDAAD